MPYVSSTTKHLNYVIGEIHNVQELQLGDICSMYGPLSGFDTMMVVQAGAREIVLCRFQLAPATTEELEVIAGAIAGAVKTDETLEDETFDEEPDFPEEPTFRDPISLVISHGTRVRPEVFRLRRNATQPGGTGPMMFYVHRRIHRN